MESIEKDMRAKMHNLIDAKVALKTFKNPALIFGDVEWCKKVMHETADRMDMSKEMAELRTVAERLGVHLSAVNESCEINHEADQSRAIAIGSGGHFRNTSTDELNVRFSAIHVSDVDLEMCTNQLFKHLIEEASSSFLVIHKNLIHFRREKSWVRQNLYGKVLDYNRPTNWKAEHAQSRERFMTRARIEPPQWLRVIDIEATCCRARQGSQRSVVQLIDYWADGVQQVGYTAISHTYGLPVYGVFNCPCASQCSSALQLHPRCSSDKQWSCNVAEEHEDGALGAEQRGENHKAVLSDILTMCDIFRKAGVSYAWHDGVCIAQHDELEVKETIMHMGWIYSSAKETIVFLHYVGKPMAPIRNSNDFTELGCRWHTRVWTLQEAAFSKCRRYCVRAGTTCSPLDGCKSLEEFAKNIDLWYGEDDSSTIEIMEEERFFEFVKEINRVLGSLLENWAKKFLSIPDDTDDDVIVQTNWMFTKAQTWYDSTSTLLHALRWTCFEFPTVETALLECSLRESKHKGDCINSILSLAEVEDFVADKDINLETSTIEFFKRQGQVGLERAVFSINRSLDYGDMTDQKHQHTWVPILWSRLAVADYGGLDDGIDMYGDAEFNVLDDGRMELRTDMVCVKVRLTARLMQEHNDIKQDIQKEHLIEISGSKERISLNSGGFLDMDLTVLDLASEFKAKLFAASECIMGNIYISAIQRCNNRTRTVTSRGIKDGYRFDVHLVIPKKCSRLGLILIVQGSLDAHVSKVGIMDPTQQFDELIEKLMSFPDLPDCITHIEKLVII